jgi:hypothetical protein
MLDVLTFASNSNSKQVRVQEFKSSRIQVQQCKTEKYLLARLLL